MGMFTSTAAMDGHGSYGSSASTVKSPSAGQALAHSLPLDTSTEVGEQMNSAAPGRHGRDDQIDLGKISPKLILKMSISEIFENDRWLLNATDLSKHVR